MNALLTLLKQTGISQKRLAEILGFEITVLNKYVLNKRDPLAPSFHIICQAEELLEEAKNAIDTIPWPAPGEYEMKQLAKEIRQTEAHLSELEKKLNSDKEKISKARMALAWLQLWEQSNLHPQKPWSSDFLNAERGFSQIKLSTHHQQKMLTFDLEQARARLRFLETFSPDISV